MYEAAHGAEKTVTPAVTRTVLRLGGSQTTEAARVPVLWLPGIVPAVDACARSRHAGIYGRRTQRHFSRSPQLEDYKPLCTAARTVTLVVLY